MLGSVCEFICFEGERGALLVHPVWHHSNFCNNTVCLQVSSRFVSLAPQERDRRPTSAWTAAVTGSARRPNETVSHPSATNRISSISVKLSAGPAGVGERDAQRNIARARMRYTCELSAHPMRSTFVCAYAAAKQAFSESTHVWLVEPVVDPFVNRLNNVGHGVKRHNCNRK